MNYIHEAMGFYYVFPSQTQTNNENQREKCALFSLIPSQENWENLTQFKIFVVKSRKMVKSNYQGGKPSVCQ